MHPSDVVRKYVRQGTVLSDRYQVENFIGSGAYGSIFSAIDTVTMERVAVKALPPADAGVNETALGRFHREMKVISSLRHPNVITMYDFGETKDRIVYMVLEFVDGPTLFDLVSGRAFSPEQALDVTRQIALGLQVAHDMGVIHRDLKPQNIMLFEERSGGYQVKVLDFGMAKLLTRINDESIIQLTREGVAVGTPRYIAPEQARGKVVGPYSDIYALGLLMYEMFSGERAVKADSIESAIMAHVSRDPLDLPEIDTVPKTVRPILFKMIEKNYKKRYQNGGELIADIETLQETIRHAHVAAKSKVAAAPKLGRKEDSPARDGVRSIHSADNLELDFERFDHYAPKKKRKRKKRRRKKSDGTPLFRMPTTRMEQIETLLAVLVAPVAFVVFTAHFHESEFAFRLLFGALPMLVAGLVSLLAHSWDWRWSFFRLWLIASILTFVGSHLMMRNLIVGLVESPAWFAQPFLSAPGVKAVADLVIALARSHVEILAQFNPDLAVFASQLRYGG